MVIPKLHYISQGNSPKEHLENIQKACSSGAELVELSLKGISEKKYLKLAEEAREITAHFQTRLLITSYYKVAKTIKADGVHLEKTDSCPTIARTHLYTWQIIGATANTIQDCEKLLSKEIDYIRLSPFKSSTSKNNIANVLGLKGYAAIIDSLKTETPIIGSGGITTEDVTAILETGISGIGVSTEITRDFNLIRKFNQLLRASSIDEQRYTL
ncbi:thiamine phosphate synthase [Polaribacter sp. Hel1_85]|uniref:thiamine phosphate synthase n=1 Tax=Polaribacter sp. Hel1_85 TaxID=1250005 RepID=UPI00052BC4C8|nr:thiamine phosphate synthase [Polaribacter sp. Hel1_85]KGL63396.1 thiamine-phosphate pyrophosphorylase ThiE [Polaribacter sp. Hel1_85]